MKQLHSSGRGAAEKRSGGGFAGAGGRYYDKMLVLGRMSTSRHYSCVRVHGKVTQEGRAGNPPSISERLAKEMVNRRRERKQRVGSD